MELLYPHFQVVNFFFRISARCIFLLQTFMSQRAVTIATQISINRVDSQQMRRMLLTNLTKYMPLTRRKGLQSGKGCQEILVIQVYQFYTGSTHCMVFSMTKIVFMMKCISSHQILWKNALLDLINDDTNGIDWSIVDSGLDNIPWPSGKFLLSNLNNYCCFSEWVFTRSPS